MARHALNDIEHDVALAGDGEISLRYVAQKNAAIGLLDAAPEAGVDPHRAGDAIAAGHHHVAQSVLVAVLAQKRVEMRVGIEQRHVLAHHVARPAYQEHVGVQGLGDEVAAADQLDRVDVLDREQPANPDGERDGDDARHHQVVVAGHFENHGDRGHRRAGATADHRRHADDGAGGRIEVVHGMNGLDQDTEGRAQGRAHEQRRREDAAGRARAETDGGRRKLRHKQNDQERGRVETAGEDRLDGRITDALDEIVPRADEERIDQDADGQHADEIAQIRIANALEEILGETQAADESGGRDADQRSQQGIEQQRVE